MLRAEDRADPPTWVLSGGALLGVCSGWGPDRGSPGWEVLGAQSQAVAGGVGEGARGDVELGGPRCLQARGSVSQSVGDGEPCLNTARGVGDSGASGQGVGLDGSAWPAPPRGPPRSC